MQNTLREFRGRVASATYLIYNKYLFPIWTHRVKKSQKSEIFDTRFMFISSYPMIFKLKVRLLQLQHQLQFDNALINQILFKQWFLHDTDNLIVPKGFV